MRRLSTIKVSQPDTELINCMTKVQRPVKALELRDFLASEHKGIRKNK